MPHTDEEPREVLPAASEPSSVVAARTLAWVEHAVIGLNLCPFAKAPWVKGQVRCVVSPGHDPASLLDELRAELRLLVEADSRKTETTLLVVPDQFAEFVDFNDFLDDADAAVAALGLEGVMQIASFHPRYQFAGTAPDDLEQRHATAPRTRPCTCCAKTASSARCEAFPEAEAIYETNIRTLRATRRRRAGPRCKSAVPADATADAISPRRAPTISPSRRSAWSCSRVNAKPQLMRRKWSKRSEFENSAPGATRMPCASAASNSAWLDALPRQLDPQLQAAGRQVDARAGRKVARRSHRPSARAGVFSAAAQAAQVAVVGAGGHELGRPRAARAPRCCAVCANLSISHARLPAPGR